MSSQLVCTTIDFQGKTTSLEKPLIVQNDVAFIPLFELKTLLNFTVSYLHKYNGYEIRYNNKIMLLSLDTHEVWINQNRHFFQRPIFQRNSTVYVPFDDLFFLLGLTATKTNNGYSLNSSTLTSLESKNSLVSFEKRHLDSVRYPYKNVVPSLTLRYKQQSLPLTGLLSQKNSIFYIKSKRLLKTLGYTYTKTATHIQLSSASFSYSIPLKSRLWTGKNKGSSWNFLAESPVIISPEGDILFPFSSFFAFLDYSLYSNRIRSSIEILDNIHGVKLQQSEASVPYISVQSRHCLDYINLKFDEKSLLYSLQVPDSIAYLSNKKQYFDSKILHSIGVGSIFYSYELSHLRNAQYGHKHTRLAIRFSHKGTILPQEESHGLSLLFKKKINRYDLKQSKDMYTITLHGTNIEAPTIYKEGQMLIFDFPNSINNLPRLKRVNQSDLRSLRASQLSYTPLTTRFVIDFNNAAPVFTTEKTTDTFTISFKKIIRQKPAIRSSKKQSLVHNKVIIIDPGHGGRDPGAVIKNNRYEKTYTLDISKRVKTLLEKDGAFVIMTRETDITRSLQHRTALANKQKADLFLSLHLNSFSSSSVHGSKTFYYKYKDKKLARHISKQLAHDLKLKNNGIARNRFFVLRHTKMPSTLIEPLFMTNPKELGLVQSEQFRQKLALSIYQGIKNYYADT